MQARSLIDQLEQHNQANKSAIEVNSLSPGQIADLCYLQRQAVGHVSYAPIEPRNLHAERPIPETARLDTRLHALYKELEKLDDS